MPKSFTAVVWIRLDILPVASNALQLMVIWLIHCTSAGFNLWCPDINECEATPSRCGNHSTCNDTSGSFLCTCNHGYRGDGQTCENIDECIENPDICQTLAECVDLDGSYRCDCRSGYTFNGTDCVGKHTRIGIFVCVQCKTS